MQRLRFCETIICLISEFAIVHAILMICKLTIFPFEHCLIISIR